MSLPTSGAERPSPTLPELDPGVQLLDIAEGHGIAPLQSLVIDHVLMHDGEAMWVDSGRHAVTSTLRDLAPSDRVLDRVHVARGFTPFQHTSILRSLRANLENASLLVFPAVDLQYRGDDVRGEMAQDMLLAALADIAYLARESGCAVLLTRQSADSFSEPVAALADRTIEYHSTQFGPRFEGEDWETQVYHLDDGLVQTTLAFWESVLEERAAMHGLGEPAPMEVTAGGSY